MEALDRHISRLHTTISILECLECWASAEVFRRLLNEAIKMKYPPVKEAA